MFLMACPEKHTTASNTPPAPDPNGYNHGTQPNGSSQTGTQPGYDGTGYVAPAGSGSNTGTTGTITDGGAATSTATTTVTSPTVDTATHVVGRPDTVVRATRLVVSFISKGEGIDHAAKANLDKWLSKHPDTKYTVIQKGREGEMKYCFPMKERDEKEQAKLIAEIKTVVGNGDLVQMSENVVCDHVHELVVTEAPVVEAEVVGSRPDTANTARVVVSFISKGEGIDYATKEKLEVWLTERGNVVWETKSFGREGETNFCFFMAGRSTREQEIFVRDLRTFIGTNDMVMIQEWGKCDPRK